MTLVLRYAARSDRGLVRSNNEDSVYAGPRLLALADGMGGHAAGEVASQLVIEALAHLDEDEPGEDLLYKLDNAMRVGNAAIADQVEEEPELDGMGTTLTALLFAGRKVGLIHIGDSRGYLLRAGELTQITRDDTFVQSLVDEGRITPEQAHTHPQRSLIMRALTGNEIDPTLIMREAQAGDRYLLCSDGLSDVVTDETLANALHEGGPDECADRLIELALRGGGPDNVTVVVADVIDVDYGQSHPIVAGALSGDEDAPPPNTAAGRAAAMRPPQAAPRRPTGLTEAAPAKKKRPLLWAAAALLLIVLLAGGGFIGFRMIQSTYYVAADGDQVAVYQGLSGTFMHNVDQVACLEGDKATLAPAGGGACRALLLTDLAPTSREQVKAGLPPGSRDNAAAQIERLTLLPLCRTEQPAGAAPSSTQQPPAVTPAPAPAPVPPAGVPAPQPAPAASAPVPTATPEPTPAPQQEHRRECREQR